MYINAQYQNNRNGEIIGIRVDINGVTSFVPLDPDNRDYAALMALKDSGNWPAAPIEGYAFDSSSMCYYVTPLYKLSNPSSPDVITIP
jgi:hypothetical protein